ncbi:ABC transporter substrate-binding protein [Litoribacillus peritrichatus]|uniref:ABC transporter substrate-binding protein n=1 Tax=Litoribacillus peritrichatus TaxID=718191 RepID=A0ABP7MRF2_9GAMM
MSRILVAVLGFCLAFSVSAGEKVFLTSLEWPPYAGRSLPEGGASVAVAKAAFAAEGYDLVVDFLPWSRAVNEAKDPSSKYSGYFPEYYSKGVEAEFVFSQEMGSGPLGFIQNTSNPVTWNSLDDLSNQIIGVVQDYVNTDDFDARVASGQQKTQAVTSDAINVRKVAGGRIPLAVIDQNVFQYLLKTDKSLKGASAKVEMNAKLLEDKKLFVCFKKTSDGKNMADIFNRGLSKINVDEIMKKYL